MSALQETEGAECMSKLGALESDIQAVTQRLARISSDAPPALPASLQQAMALANSRKRKSCEVLPSSQLVSGPEAKRGHSLDNSRSGWLLTSCAGSEQHSGNMQCLLWHRGADQLAFADKKKEIYLCTQASKSLSHPSRWRSC